MVLGSVLAFSELLGMRIKRARVISAGDISRSVGLPRDHYLLISLYIIKLESLI